MRRNLIALLPLMVLALPVRGEDWPQWRGPNRNGILTESRLPKKWPEKLPAYKWRGYVGEGYSSPVAAGGRVFLMGREAGAMETCLCFDAETGKRLWRISYSCKFVPPDPTAGKGPNSTPTVDGDRVYMLGLGGMFHCLDVKTGRVLWQHDFAKEYWGVEKDKDQMEAWSPPCGTASSALVVGDQVIISVGGKKAGAITAFDRKNGKILWKSLPDRGSYASPMLTNLAGVKQIVGFTGLRMVGLDFTDHKLLWEFPFKAMFEQTIITPVFWKDHVIVSGEAKPTTALQISRQGDKVMQKVAWKNSDLSAYLVTPVVIKDHLIGVDQRARRMVCIDLASGKTIWTSERLMKQYSTLTVVGEQILLLNDLGELHAFEANTAACVPLGKWKVSEAGVTWSHLAIVGTRLFLKDKEHLMCLDLAL